MRAKILYDTLSTCIERFKWIHLTIGIIGNLLFVTGTVLFLQDHDFAGWFFLAGSTGMLVNAIGDLIAETETDGKTAITNIGYHARLRRLEEQQKELQENYSGNENDGMIL